MGINQWFKMERKLYKCIECGREVQILSKKRCQRCRYNQRVKNNEIKIKVSKNKRNRAGILKTYYEYHLREIKKKPYCENCGLKIQGSVMNICHIFPKRSTANPEIMDELNNVLYLCGPFDNTERDCHSHFDKSQSSIKVFSMKCFPTAVKRYLTFSDKCRYNKYVEIFELWLKENEHRDIK